MPIIFTIAFLIFTCIVPVYLFSFWKFYKIVQAEKPEWLKLRGSLSFFYDGMPSAADPNVQNEVLRIAFGARARELQNSSALIHAKRIRVLLPIGILLFLAYVVGVLYYAP